MEELSFTVDSALLSELGEKLVESAHVALVELVKNSYDADATLVTVKISPQDRGGPVIDVVDNGTGMTFDEVQLYWMRVATTNKATEQLSRGFGRPRTGSKGIGRFSCRRLGKALQLTTTAKVQSGWERTEMQIDWPRFSPGTDIATVKCRASRSNLSSGNVGTALHISGQDRDEWRKRGYDYLKRQLAVLTANRGRRRRGHEEDPGFNIRLEAPGFSEEITDLRERMIAAGWGDLSIAVDKSGNARYTLRALRIGEKTATAPAKYRNLAGTKAIIGIMPMERHELRDVEILSKGNLREILTDWGGIYIRFRGFRIYPYGEPGNDWLNIDRDRGLRKPALSESLQAFARGIRGVDPHRALLSLLSGMSYIGDVELGPEVAGFELKASREGFLGEDALEELRSLVRFGIDWSTIYREHARAVEASDAARKARRELEVEIAAPVNPRGVISAAVRAIDTEVRSVATRLPAQERQAVLRSLNTATHAISEHDKSNVQQLRHLQLVASTSTLLLIFSHEVKGLLASLDHASSSLEAIGRRLPVAQAERVQKIRDKLNADKRRFVDLLNMTSLISVASKGAKPLRLELRSRMEQAAHCFDLIARDYEIALDLDGIPRGLQVGPMLEAELFAVLLNVLSNSIKSVIAAGGAKKVVAEAARADGLVCLRIRDNGVGLDESQFERVFEPFVADPEGVLYAELGLKLNPEDAYFVGTGSGLGLSISREILAYRGGSIQFVHPEGTWKAEVEVVLP